MDKQTQELLTKEAEAREELENRVATLEENSPQPSSDSLLSEDAEAQLKEKDDRITKLEGRGIGDYPAEDRATFLQETLTRFDEETVAIILAKVGKAGMLKEATVAEVEEAEKPEGEDAEVAEAEEAGVIMGKTDKPGYKYLAALDISIKQKETE